MKLRVNNITVAGVESADAGTSDLSSPDSEIKERLERLKVGRCRCKN